jgi:acetoin utilization deacetylase AcuC-like enzyme
MKIIFSKKCLEYSKLKYPENPYRLESAYTFLNEKYDFVEPKAATKLDLLKVHSKKYVELFEKKKFKGDRETPNFPKIYEYAKLSAGAAILAAKIKGFSLMRPPGHHVGINGKTHDASSLGFCYFNNAVIAVRSLGVPSLIIDIDDHHGNGTEEIVFGDKNITFISLHRRGIYPGTGYESKNNCYNYPLSSSTDDEKYVKVLDEALRKIDLTKIKVICISAGFDTLQNDSLTPLQLTRNAYFKIGKKIKETGIPVFVVLEGGYHKFIGECSHNLIQGLN